MTRDLKKTMFKTDCKKITFTFRETSIFQHNGGPTKDTPYTSEYDRVLWCSEGSQGDPIMTRLILMVSSKISSPDLPEYTYVLKLFDVVEETHLRLLIGISLTRIYDYQYDQ